MRRSAVALAALVSLVIPATAFPAPYPTPTKLTVSITDQGLLDQSISGATDGSQLVELKVVKPGGGIKAVARTLAGVSGSYTLRLSLEQRIEPGDRVHIVLGDNADWTYSMVYSRVRLTGFDTGAGTISGIVTPRKPRVYGEMSGTRVVADPVDLAKEIPVTWHTAGAGRSTDAAGRFTFTPTLTGPGWEGSYQRSDQIVTSYKTYPVAGNPAFVFKVLFYPAFVPGSLTVIGGNFNYLYGIPGTNQTATLRAPGGATKGTAVAGLFSSVALYFYQGPGGSSASVSTGDTITVSGPGGFTTVVPPLRAAIRTATDKVQVFGPPRARIRVNLTLYDDNGATIPAPPAKWVRTDADGKATLTPGFDLRIGDRAQLSFKDPRGNTWMTLMQSLPATP